MYFINLIAVRLFGFNNFFSFSVSGNIALHLLTKKTRNNFDLETIWSIGDKYDSHLNEPADALVALLNEHSFSLQNLEPADGH